MNLTELKLEASTRRFVSVRHVASLLDMRRLSYIFQLKNLIFVG
jgi:hypothetical protein